MGCRYVESPAGDGTFADQRDYVKMLIARFDEDAAPFRAALTVKRVDVPAIDADGIRPTASDNVKGRLFDVAARHVAGALYAARHSRPDISQAVNALSRRLGNWTQTDDRALARLVETFVRPRSSCFF